MVEKARERNLLLGVAQVFRFESTTAAFRERVSAGHLEPVRAQVIKRTGIQQLIEERDRFGNADRRGLKWHDYGDPVN